MVALHRQPTRIRIGIGAAEGLADLAPLWALSVDLGHLFAGCRRRRRLADEEAVDHEGRPGAHVADDDQDDGQQVDYLVLVAETNSVGLAGLELGEDLVELDQDGAVEDAEAELAEPGLEQTGDAGGLEVADEDLLDGWLVRLSASADVRMTGQIAE